MPDISMCVNKTCPHRKKCYRNKASGTIPDDKYQSYADFAPDEAGICNMKWIRKSKGE